MLSLLFSIFFLKIAYAESGMSDDVLDLEVRPANFTMYELSPVDMAPFLLDEKRLSLVRQVRPSVVELYTHHSGNSATGVIVGYTAKNQPLILTSGSTIMYRTFELARINSIGLDDPRGLRNNDISNEHTHLVRTSWMKENTITSQGWFGLPLFHPRYVVNEGTPMIRPEMNFGYYIMTGRTYNIGQYETDISERYTIQSSLETGFEVPGSEAIKTASVELGKEVLVMGRTHHVNHTQTAYGNESRVVKYEMSYVFAEATAMSAKYKSNQLTDEQFFVRGDIDEGMKGAGVFNLKGELVGVIVDIIRNTNHARTGNALDLFDRTRVQTIGAVALRIEHVLKQTEILSKQTELLKMVVAHSPTLVAASCRQIFAK